MTGAVAAACGPNMSSASGSMDANGAGPTVTSATRTMTVPIPSPRTFAFRNFVDVGIVLATEYQKNGGAWTACPDGTTVSLANADTIATRTQGLGAGESRAIDFADDYMSGRLLEVINHQAP